MPKDALCELARRAGVAPERSVIGRIRHVGDGLSNVVFRGAVRLRSDRETDVVIKLPAPRAKSDRDPFVRKATTFESWEAMQKEAGVQWVKAQLLKGLR
jgi:hypothetical protein